MEELLAKNMELTGVDRSEDDLAITALTLAFRIILYAGIKRQHLRRSRSQRNS